MSNFISPHITIACCVYNTHGDLLIDCLESLVNQDYNNYDILVIDNNSNNIDTIRVLNKYSLLYPQLIKIIKKNKNTGLHDSRNLAFKNSVGDFIGFVDSDDVISRIYLKQLANGIKNSDNIKTISKVNFKRFTENIDFLDKESTTHTFSRDEAILRLLTERIMPSVWGTIFPTSIFNNFECNENNGVDDMQINLHAFSKCDLVVCNNMSLYGWRNTSGSGMKNSEFLKLVDVSLNKWLMYSYDSCHDATNYLEFRTKVSKVKCLIVDNFHKNNLLYLRKLILPYFKSINKDLKSRKALYISFGGYIKFKAMFFSPIFYSFLYSRHRRLL